MLFVTASFAGVATDANAQTVNPSEVSDAPDALVLTPPEYGTLQPPAAEGLTLIDPVFSTPILRLTHAKNAGAQLITHDYARAAALNDDDSLVLVHNAGQYMVFTSDGQKLADLPGVAGRYAEPRWMHGEPSSIMYLSGNRVMRMDVRTLESREIAAFPEYTRVYSGEEQDISEDGRHYALLGQVSGKDVEAFILDIHTGTTGPRLDLRNAPRTLNWIATSPDNELVLAWNHPFGTGRQQGVELYDANMNFVRQLAPWMSHGDICRNAAGEALYVQSNAASPTPYQNEHWMVGHRLADGVEIPLQKLTWEQVPHVSCNRPGASEWALVSLYLPSNPSAAAFAPFDNEVYQLALDGSQRVRRLFHHRSRPIGGSYFYESRASGSRSGRYAVFASNFGKSITGSADYTDTYLAALPVSESPNAPIADIPPEDAGNPGEPGTPIPSHDDKPVLLKKHSGPKPILVTEENVGELQSLRPGDTGPWLARSGSGCSSAGSANGPETTRFTAVGGFVALLGLMRIGRRRGRW